MPPEAWLRGPVDGVPDRLQPSAGFHLQHTAGVIDRLFTYARGVPLSSDRRADDAGANSH